MPGALANGKTANAIGRELISRRANPRYADASSAVLEGDLPDDANAAEPPRYIVTVMYGMAVLAASGATRGELRRVIQTALRAWPK